MELITDEEVHLFYGTKDDFQVRELSLASLERFWFRETGAKSKDKA